MSIKRITEDERSRPVHGVASNCFCDLAKGAAVKVIGPFGTTFPALLGDPHAYVFVCGHKRMETGVHLALADICERHGLRWESLLPELTDAGRFHVETYH